MSRVAWNAIISSKQFYVLLYRKLGNILVISLVCNFLLGLLATHMYFNRGEPNYYSTNGATPPVGLSAMTTPNESSIPLLGSDPDKAQSTMLKTSPE